MSTEAARQNEAATRIQAAVNGKKARKNYQDLLKAKNGKPEPNPRPEHLKTLDKEQYQRYTQFLKASKAKFDKAYTNIQKSKMTENKKNKALNTLFKKLETADQAAVPCPEELVDEALKARFEKLTNIEKSNFIEEMNKVMKNPKIPDEQKALSLSRKMAIAEAKSRIEDEFETYSPFSEEFEIMDSSPEMQEAYKVLTAAKEASAKAHAALAKAQKREMRVAKQLSDLNKNVRNAEKALEKLLKSGVPNLLAQESIEKDIALKKKALAPYEEELQKAKDEVAEKTAEVLMANKNVRIAQNPFLRARIAELEAEQSKEGMCAKTNATTEEDCKTDKRCEWVAHRFDDDRSAAPWADLSLRKNRMFPEFLRHALEADQCVDIRGAEISALTEMIEPEPVIVAPEPPVVVVPEPPVVVVPEPPVTPVDPVVPNPPATVKDTSDESTDDAAEESSSMQNGVALVFAVIVLFGMF